MSATAGRKRSGKPGRRGRSLPIGRLLPAAAPRARRSRGFVEARLVTDWDAIVGGAVAAVSLPEKLSGGVLTVRVTPGRALDLQHREPLIVERIATFFGNSAVRRLRLRQGDVVRPEAPRRREPRPLTPDEREALRDCLAGVDDVGLREALDRLGQAILGAAPEP